LNNKPELLFQREIHHDLIEVWQQDEIRWLSINRVEQTRINIEHPERLASPVYHAYLAVLLFINKPESVLLAGSGGGAVTRYLHHKDPDIRGDAIEIIATVAELAKKYFEFPEAGWNLNINDIKRWQGNHYDLIFLDIAEAGLTPEWLVRDEMLLHLKQQLTPNGALVINLLVTNDESFSKKLKLIRNVFKRRTLCLSVPGYKNVVVYAFNQQPPYRETEDLESRLSDMEEIWGIDFEKQLGQLQKDNPFGSGIF